MENMKTKNYIHPCSSHPCVALCWLHLNLSFVGWREDVARPVGRRAAQTRSVLQLVCQISRRLDWETIAVPTTGNKRFDLTVVIMYRISPSESQNGTKKTSESIIRAIKGWQWQLQMQGINDPCYCSGNFNRVNWVSNLPCGPRTYQTYEKRRSKNWLPKNVKQKCFKNVKTYKDQRWLKKSIKKISIHPTRSRLSLTSREKMEMKTV